MSYRYADDDFRFAFFFFVLQRRHAVLPGHTLMYFQS